MKCMVPETGITINPIGELVICCAGDNIALAHIKDVSDLTEFFNGEVYNTLREDFQNQKFPKQCDVCWRHWENGRIARFSSYNQFIFPTYEEDKVKPIIPIRYLEITTSNICNQMCVTCSGKYSSKWAPYERMAVESGLAWRDENHKFHTEMYKMTKKDVDKVLDIVPHLQHLTIKGGEPFADPNNIKILQKLADTNPGCRVEICTNFQLVTDYVIELLHRLDDVHVQASIDGIHEMYDWIRGGNFKKTMNNIDRYHSVAGRQVSVVSTISVYNWFHISDLIDYFIDVPGVHRISMANLVVFPKYCSPNFLYPQHIEQGKQKLLDYLETKFKKVQDYHWWNEKLLVINMNNVLSAAIEFDGYLSRQEIQKRMIQWINYCLVARENNEDIYELAPHLKEYI